MVTPRLYMYCSRMVPTFTRWITTIGPRCILRRKVTTPTLYVYCSITVPRLTHGIVKTQLRCMLHHNVATPTLHAYCSNMVRISMCGTRRTRHHSTSYWPCGVTDRQRMILITYGSF